MDDFDGGRSQAGSCGIRFFFFFYVNQLIYIKLFFYSFGVLFIFFFYAFNVDYLKEYTLYFYVLKIIYYSNTRLD